MAILTKIRNRSTLLLICIGIALAAFVLGDFWKKGGNSDQITDIGVVAGQKISYRDFEEKFREQEELFKQQGGEENMTPEQAFQIRQSVWEQMVKDIIMTKEYDELGIIVSPAELNDMIRGKNPHQYIIQTFTDPQTGQFNPAVVDNFLKTMDQREPAVKQRYLSLEKAIKEERIVAKYNNLLRLGYYVPRFFGKLDYEAKNKLYKIRLAGLKYNNIADNDSKIAKINQEELEKYYETHKHEFEQEQSRDFEYVVFDVLPSAEDKKKADETIAKIRIEFEKAENIGEFVNANSETKYDSLYHKKDFFPKQIDTLIYNEKPGTILGPLYDNYTYRIAKLLDVQMRPDSLKASHILIAYKGGLRADEKITRTKIQAKKIADSILGVVKKDVKLFDQIAKTISDDPTAKQKGGDLGWFTDGAMVREFNNACINNKKGDIVIAETAFGYHIINVTDKTSPVKKIQVALIEIKVLPSGETDKSIFTIANDFANQVTTIESFEKVAKQKGFNVRNAEFVKNMDNTLPSVETPREIIRWACDDKTKKGEVSKVFEIGDKKVVVVVKTIREKGIPALEEIKADVEKLVKRDKKADILIEKFNNELKSSKDINAIAIKLNIPVDTIDMLSYASYSLSSHGPELEVIGKIFSQSKNSLSKPIKGKQGVYTVIVDDVTEPTPTTDYNNNRMQLINSFASRAGYDINRILEKKANIVDNRIKFY